MTRLLTLCTGAAALLAETVAGLAAAVVRATWFVWLAVGVAVVAAVAVLR